MKLNPGDTKCPHCKSGRRILYDNNEYCGTRKCPFCDGKGKLDWIEKVVGVKKDPYAKNDDPKFSDLFNEWKVKYAS